MQAIDEVRWQAVLDALSDARDLNQFGLLQQAQRRWGLARAAADDFAARRPLGQRANEDLVAMHERDRREIQNEVDAAAHEVQRIEKSQATASARRNALEELVTGIRNWAQAQGLHLPGGEMTMGGFAQTIHIQTPRGQQPFGMSGRIQ